MVAIFAAAAVPIMIMGGILEIGKLVTAVWLHKYWKQAAWWLKYYLATAVLVLMFITSMGIFGFLSKAHIEQTSAGEESVAQVQQIESEISRQRGLIARAEEKIVTLENSGTTQDTNVQSQIDKEQDRIDKAFDRIKPAIEQQNKIITDARTTDTSRTKPYEDQLTSIQAEVLRLESSASEYETKIAGLKADSSGVEPLLAQIAGLEAEIIRVTNQLQSKERDQIRAGQAIIGVTSDGAFGGNTRRALVAWVAAQRDRITQIQGEVASVRNEATKTVKMERFRLAGVVKDIREVQIPALKTRELTMLGKIDEVRQTESPVIATARDEIQRLRESAEQQVAQSQGLINRLRSQLAQIDKADEVDADIDEQMLRIKTAEAELDTLVEEKYTLEGEYRKLEAEVGPIKYIAEFIYGEQADKNLLEKAVTWVIVIIIFVFDPLAVLLLIASQYTFEWRKTRKDDDGDRLRRYEQARAQRIVDNVPPNFNAPTPPKEKEEVNERVDQPTDSNIQDDDVEPDERDREADDEESLSGRSDVEPAEEQVPDSSETQERTTAEQDTGGSATASEQVEEESEEEKARRQDYETKEQDEEWQTNKTQWKADNPNETLKQKKLLYIKGLIDELPWEAKKGYEQNAEQGDGTMFNKLRKE
ncbi:hypothetical protein OAP94_01540 [bacterium]|nr:hypothetical protein [bacterium]MDC1007344.1 hypothetical protein [bacterium]